VESREGINRKRAREGGRAKARRNNIIESHQYLKHQGYLGIGREVVERSYVETEL